jgi:protein involved in polysaccharide export with SLBB domain
MRIATPCVLIVSALTAVAQDRPKNVIVVEGSVAKPGSYPVLDPAVSNTVTTAIAQAGGLIPYAAHNAFVIRVDDQGVTLRIQVALWDIINHKKPDVRLLAGDVLQIPDTPKRKRPPAIDIPKLQPAAPRAA